MIRRIIKIDEQKCNGCGLCATACHEQAIEIIDGKARLIKDDYCDGLGDCLPACPTNAISFEEREAAAYDEQAVKARLQNKSACACAGSVPTSIQPVKSGLKQWPVQIRLAPIAAPFYENANLVIAADCVAYAYGDFHGRFLKDSIVLIGCTKLDMTDYSQKLASILSNNHIKSVQTIRMEVPCCSGIENATREALKLSGKVLPWQVFTISTKGEIIE